MRLVSGSIFLLVTTFLLVPSGVLRAQETARLHGRLSLELEGLSLEDAGEIVVFLTPTGRSAGERDRVLADWPRSAEAIRQSGASFEPDFLVVSRGQRIEMPNDDVIYHNVFSYSEPNDFDLGMYAAGESRTLQFEHGGLVRIYCSIHDEMNGLIFVSPSPLFSTPGATGGYLIADVPPGTYQLHVWSERLPEIVEPLALGPGEVRRVDLVLGAADTSH